MTVLGRDRDVGHPDEAMLSALVRPAAFQDVQPASAVRDRVDPGVLVPRVVAEDAPAVFRTEDAQGLKLPPDRRQGALLQGGEEAPVVVLAEREARLVAAVSTSSRPR